MLMTLLLRIFQSTDYPIIRKDEDPRTDSGIDIDRNPMDTNKNWFFYP